MLFRLVEELGGDQMNNRWLCFAIAASLAALSGCATNAQRRAQGMRSSLTAIGAAATKCISTINAEPRFAPLWVRAPRPPASPTMEQLADSSYATPDEVILEEAHHDAILPCRDTALAQLDSVDSRVGLLFGKTANDADSIVLSLVQRKITWGESNQRLQQLVQASQQELRNVGIQIDGELAEQNAAELAHRAEVAQAIGQALSAAAQAAEAAQAARPIVTTCNGGTGYATCVTR
jgi:hypothetical protein